MLLLLIEKKIKTTKQDPSCSKLELSFNKTVVSQRLKQIVGLGALRQLPEYTIKQVAGQCFDKGWEKKVTILSHIWRFQMYIGLL